MVKKAIFMYDYTGFMAKPWMDAGYECWCFDGQHEHGVVRDGLHVKVGMWFYPDNLEAQAAAIKEMVGEGVVMVFGFPECTHLASSGAVHFRKKLAADPLVQVKAMKLADLVRQIGELCGSPWAFENPVGVLSTIYRKPDFTFNPCDYAQYLPQDDVHPTYPEIYPGRDRYNKKTCIWSGNGFAEPEKQRIEPEHENNPGWKKLGGKSLKTKNIRSATPRGFARAVFEANHGGEEQ